MASIDPRGGSVSHRQAGVTRAALGGLLRHNFRDLDKAAGREVSHSNGRIVPARTAENTTWMWVDGAMVRPASIGAIVEEMDRRLSGACSSIRAASTRTNKKTGKVTTVAESRVAVKKNARIVRDIVLQLDPAITGTVENPLMTRESVEAALMVMVSHYADLYGAENLLALSIHWDETSPHAHLLLTPIDDQQRVRNSSFIADGRGRNSGMARNDKAMRQRMIGAGYNVSPEPTGSGRGHMSVEAYARHAGWVSEVVEREAEAAAAEAGVAVSREVVGKQAAKVRRDDAAARKAVMERERAVEAREVEVRAAEGQLEARMAALAVDEAAVLEAVVVLDAAEARGVTAATLPDEIVASRAKFARIPLKRGEAVRRIADGARRAAEAQVAKQRADEVLARAERMVAQVRGIFHRLGEADRRLLREVAAGAAELRSVDKDLGE